jgi:lipopolysaccharide transport system permease protein
VAHAAPAVPAAVPTLELTGESVPLRELLAGLVRHWRLLPMLARHEFHARYRSTILGVLWSVFLPLLQGAALAVVFTKFVRIHTTVSYVPFVIVGMNTWSYFSSTLSSASSAIVDHSDLAGRVYFPRMVLAGVPAVTNFVGFAISMLIALVIAFAFGIHLHWTQLLLPVVLLVPALLATALGEILTVLHVYFRDVRYIVTALLLVWLYATPVIYPLSRVHHLLPYVEANPMTGVVQLARWSVLGTAGGLAEPLEICAGWIVGCALIAVLVYRRYERVACDRL